ncbi:ABC transporter permease [Nocardioides sp. KR10-350]|uniref:ABC transporter permease n=1 Tax=Nocardioides cheoyonin TaxID=3156615 RepID=UPI0032B572AA
MTTADMAKSSAPSVDTAEVVRAGDTRSKDRRAAARIRRRRQLRRTLLSSLTGLAFLACWQGAVAIRLLKPIQVSSPSRIIQTLGDMLSDGSLMSNLGISAREFAVGYVIALVVAVPLGVAIGWYGVLRDMFEPLLAFFNAVPYVTLLPVFVIWFGLGAHSTMACVAMGAFFPIVTNTMAGISSVDSTLVKCARAFGARDLQFFRTVALPSAIPFIASGVRLSVATALIATIVGELYASNSGLGYMIANAGIAFQTDKVMAGIVVVATIGVILTGITRRIERHFQKWRPAAD